MAPSDLKPCKASAGRDWNEYWPGYSGEAVYERIFHPPGNRFEHERVWLRFDRVMEQGRVWLNGQDLGIVNEQGGAWDITERLSANCRLRVEVRGSAERASGLVGDVWLEIGPVV